MYSGYYINAQTMGKLVRDSEIWSQKEPLHKHQRTQLNPLLRVAFSKTKIKFPSVYITNMKYFIVIVVFLPQQGERVQRERQPLWVGRPHFSSRFLDTNLLNWENTHTSLLLRISNKSNTHTSLLLRISQIGGGNAQKVFGWICMHLPKEQDRHTRTKFWFQTQNWNFRQICSVEHNLFEFTFASQSEDFVDAKKKDKC